MNLIIRSVQDIKKIAAEENQRQNRTHFDSLGDISKYQAEIERLKKRKERAYEDYADGLITKDEYRQYRDKYQRQIAAAGAAIEKMNRHKERMPDDNPWMERLLRHREFHHLDRDMVVEMLSMIYVYEDNTIKIVYNFSEELEAFRDRETGEAPDLS